MSSSKKKPTRKPSLLDDEIEASCPQCGSESVYGISRVVGYFSKIDSWNDSKFAEFKRRQKGNYWTEEDI